MMVASAGVNELAHEIEAAVASLASARTASVRALRRDYSKRLREQDGRFVIDLALRLWQQNNVLRREGRVHRFFGDELVANHRGAQQSLTCEDVLALGEGLSSWDEVDCFSLFVAGPAWRSGRIDDALVQGWARSHDLWWRRAAVVSTVALNARAQGGTGDTPRTLAVCRMLAADRDDMVVKAMSWALRILSQRDTPAVRDFLEVNRARLAARVIREVENKLNTGLKNPQRNPNL
jgi:3-methyladenine DNA glycosylase AlkD